MDLSGLKWPIIILVIVGIGWLVSSGGVNYMYKQYTKATPGQNAEKDKRDEAGLSKWGGFLMQTFRVGKADQFFNAAVQRYPNGANVLYNKYRMVKCAEKANDIPRALTILDELQAVNANSKDPRVPEVANLKLRRDKLAEMHELGTVR